MKESVQKRLQAVMIVLIFVIGVAAMFYPWNSPRVRWKKTRKAMLADTNLNPVVAAAIKRGVIERGMSLPEAYAAAGRYTVYILNAENQPVPVWNPVQSGQELAKDNFLLHFKENRMSDAGAYTPAFVYFVNGKVSELRKE